MSREAIKKEIFPNSPLQKGEKEEIEKSIFATIAYYDYFNYPLTAVEIYNYLIKPDIQIHSELNFRFLKSEKQNHNNSFKSRNNKKPIFLDIIEALDNSEKLKKNIDRKNGFYFLSGREGIIRTRIQKKKLADEKLRKSKRILSFISALPFVSFVAISGSMGIGNPDRKSDIDLLVIVKHGRIWTARAFLTFFALAFDAYRHSDKTDNRLCLNHYITEHSLAIDFGNLYKAQEYINLFPVAGDITLYKKFIDANINWLDQYIYFNFENSMNKNLYFMCQSKISSAIKKTMEFFLLGIVGELLENFFKKIQIYFIKNNPLTKHPHSRIRYSNENLVFHPILVEPIIIEQYEKKMKRFKASAF